MNETTFVETPVLAPIDVEALPEPASYRVAIEDVRPSVDGGRFPIKRTVGEWVDVVASVFADGHDEIAAVLLSRSVSSRGVRAQPIEWREAPMAMQAAGSDNWTGRFFVDAPGWHEYAVLAWVDRFRTWQRDLRIKAAAGQDVSLELLEGSLLVRDAATRAEQSHDVESRAHADCLLHRADLLSDSTPVESRVAVGLDADLRAMMYRDADRSRATESAVYRLWADRERARTGAWYEMFPRSAGPDAHRSGTFEEAAQQLPRIADLGFDVVYLPPIHPIGRRFRKGRNNRLTAEAGDPGSPWAIGSAEGGHAAVEPGLGTLDDFELFRSEAERLGLELALDLAWQCSPDHPWVREHPEWFRHRPDGTIKYAENPPKKYQDIYPFDFECEDWRALWRELLAVTLMWVGRGVRIFRVDNPHTKSLRFWEWLIQSVQSRSPDVIFLAEAFTRPPLMRYLAKSGFTQSYTYFTWRNTKPEIEAYLTELTSTDVRDYLRPNLFANTPDILHAYLQDGGRPAFEARLILAATLGATYGIYSGFELCENRAVPGTEEYLDSEKYQFRKWPWHGPGNIEELVARVNGIRHEERALQFDSTLQFHRTDNPELIAYSKSAPDGQGDALLTIVNLDPQHMQHGFVEVPPVLRPASGNSAAAYAVCDRLTDQVYQWRGDWNYVRLEPGKAHILKVQRSK